MLPAAILEEAAPRAPRVSRSAESVTPLTVPIPSVIRDLRAGRELDDLRAVAARLWLSAHGDAVDPDRSLREAVQAYWASRPGDDPYWAFLEDRGSCDACGESYRFENLSICPECLRTYCPRHRARCICGFDVVG